MDTAGKRRIHERPNRTEVLACHHWLEQELEIVDPEVVIALGATAGQALWGSSFRVGVAHGKTLELDARPAVATIHPSALLREPRLGSATARTQEFIDDLVHADGLRSSRRRQTS